MCMGCGSQDHEGKIKYARNSENSRDTMEHQYSSRQISYNSSKKRYN